MNRKISVTFKRVSRYGFNAEVPEDLELGLLDKQECLEELQTRRVEDDQWIETYDELEAMRERGNEDKPHKALTLLGALADKCINKTCTPQDTSHLSTCENFDSQKGAVLKLMKLRRILRSEEFRRFYNYDFDRFIRNSHDAKSGEDITATLITLFGPLL